jgi:dTDP-4-dehydrorhamnose reductase
MTLTQYLGKRKYEVLATSRNSMDVRNSKLVNDVISSFGPDVVFHLAAITDLELCEECPDLAADVNTRGTENVIDACNAIGCKTVYISTGAVFDGTKKGAYEEGDKPNPLSVYGRTKYWGELLVASKSKHSLIVRGGWLFGGFEKDKKFVAKILSLLASGAKEIYAVDDTCGSPTYTKDFVVALELLALSGVEGIYHIVNRGFATRYIIAERIVQVAGMKGVKVKRVSSAYFKQTYPVPRVANETLGATKLLKRGLSIRPWEDALAEYVQEYFQGVECSEAVGGWSV